MGLPRLAFDDPGEARPDVRRAYHMLVWDGVFAQSMATLITGAFFTSYVLALGASNTLVGVLNAAAPLALVLQWPAAAWVVRARSWRSVTVITAAIGRSAWFAAALLPWWAPVAWRLPLLLGVISIHFIANGITCCAFNAWMRAIIPAHAAGRFFGHRTAWATAAGVATGLGAGYVVQRAELAGNAIAGYSACIAAGAVIGWAGLWFLQATPDAPREVTYPEAPLNSEMLVPDRTRSVYLFLGLWNFALNLMQPFITVYLLRAIHLDVAWTMALTMAGQALNVLLYPTWGRLADRYTNRAVLRVACGAGATLFLLWPLAAHAQAGFVQMLLALVALFGGGAAQSGASLCCYLLNLKSAPAQNTAHGIARGNGIAGIAALGAAATAGWLADSLEGMGLRNATGFSGLDAVFLLAALLGLMAAAWLARVEETGTGRGRDVLRALFSGIV